MRNMPLFVILLSFFIALPGLLFCLTEEQGSFKQFLMGTEPGCAYDNWLTHISEGLALPGYNAYPPWDRQTNGFGAYNFPDHDQNDQWNEISSYFVNQDWISLDNSLTAYNIPYELVRFQDQDTGRLYYILRENLVAYYDDNGTPTPADDESGSFNLGWGLFVFNPSAISSVIITIPHPNDDYIAIPLGWKAFTTLDARYFFINGAGREVVWTNEGTYNNSKAVSDPSRNPEHPMHFTYTKSCEEIRNLLNNTTRIIKREFSMQTHSYDTNLHIGYANCQISAGNGQNCPNLPIRDLSQTVPDMVNAAGYLIHPANSIGNNTTVTTSNFWCANYSYYPYVFNDGINQQNVSNQVDLPGYGYNNQMLYSINGWNSFDVYDPFFHIEMDELPDCYTQNDSTLAWFYGWDTISQSWNLSTRYDKVIAYYQPWVTALATSLNSTINMNDNHAPATPVLNSAVVFDNSVLSLNWQRLYEYDFDSWIVSLQRLTYAGNGNYNVVDTLYFDRNQKPTLVDQALTSIDISEFPAGYFYRVWLTARDKSNRISTASQSRLFAIYANPPLVTNLAYNRNLSDDNHITIEWTSVPGYIPIVNYRVERRFREASVWENLAVLPQNQARFIDNTFSNPDSLTYEYRIVTMGLGEQIFVPSNSCTGYLRAYPAPQCVSIRPYGDGIIGISWDGVSQTIGGQSDIPDYYIVTKSNVLTFDNPETLDIVVTEGNEYMDTFTPTGSYDPICFYRVRAVALDQDRLTRIVQQN